MNETFIEVLVLLAIIFSVLIFIPTILHLALLLGIIFLFLKYRNKNRNNKKRQWIITI